MKPYYKDDYVTIYHGDCREIVPTLGRFDLLLTDPPYGIGTWNDRSESDETRFCQADFGWDQRPSNETMVLCLASARKAIVFGFNHLAEMLGATKGVIVWDKKFNGVHFNDCELAWTRGINDACRMFRFSPASADRKQHPTEKPLALMNWCIGLAGDVQTILDPFAGSGTTGRAAKDLGRKAVLIEREERYCEIAARRMEQEVLPLCTANRSIELPAEQMELQDVSSNTSREASWCQ
jgi:DNA modification methylase